MKETLTGVRPSYDRAFSWTIPAEEHPKSRYLQLCYKFMIEPIVAKGLELYDEGFPHFPIAKPRIAGIGLICASIELYCYPIL